jgi:hypothetical protein
MPDRGSNNNALLSSLMFGGLIVAVVMVLVIGWGNRNGDDKVAADMPKISAPR